MRFTLLFFTFSLHWIYLHGQNNHSYLYPDGIYKTLEEFLAKEPDTTSVMKRLNLGVPRTEAFKDTMVDRMMFLDEENDPIKKVFAVVFQGEIYFPAYAIRKHLMDGYGHGSIVASPKMYRVQARGRYLYGEARYVIRDPGAAVTMGMMFGLAGALAGTAMTPEEENFSPFVFDTKLNRFFVFVLTTKLEKFMSEQYPAYTFDMKEKITDVSMVRELFIRLNQLDPASD